MKIAYLTNSLPSYRADFINRALNSKILNITIFCHKNVYGHNFEPCRINNETKVNYCQTVGLFGGSVIVSRIPIFQILKNYDVIISDGNPRHASFAVLSTIGSIIGKRVIIWSTSHSRRNLWLTKIIRRGWWRCFSEFLSYTENDARVLSKTYPNAKCYSANNGINQAQIEKIQEQISLDSRTRFSEQHGLKNKKIAISIGRIIPGRFDLMVKALPKIVKSIPDFVWILIGGGEGENSIKNELRKCGMEDRAILVGALHREEEIGLWFSVAQIFVYPEAIGLSLHHAFGYELPVVTHDQVQFHGPEIDIFQNDLTGRMFEKDNPESLSDVVINLIGDPEECSRMGKNGKQIVKNHYNSEIMFQRVSEFILK